MDLYIFLEIFNSWLNSSPRNFFKFILFFFDFKKIKSPQKSRVHSSSLILVLSNLNAFFSKGIFDMSKIIALTGSQIKDRKYFKIIQGLNISSMVKNNLKKGEKRYISGSILNGRKIEKDGFVGFYDDQITVIPEGNYYQFFGWALPGFHKYSFSRLFFSWLNEKKEYVLDSNMNGEERAFVVSGQYEDLFPMDIYTVHLIKAIMKGTLKIFLIVLDC